MAITIGDGELGYGSAVFEASDGTKIAVFLNSSGSIEVWKDIDGTPSIIDTATPDEVHGGVLPAIGYLDAAIDSNDDIHVVSAANAEQVRDIAYRVCDLTTGWVGSWEEAADYTEGTPNMFGCAISIDSNDYPHILFVDSVKSRGSTQDNVYHDYNDGSWSGAEQVGLRSTKTFFYNTPRITLCLADDVQAFYRASEEGGSAILRRRNGTWGSQTKYANINAVVCEVVATTGDTVYGYWNSFASIEENGNDTGYDTDSGKRTESASLVGTERYVFYIDTNSDIHVISNTGSGWTDESAQQTGTYDYVMAEWAYNHEHQVFEINYIFDDGTSVYFDTFWVGGTDVDSSTGAFVQGSTDTSSSTNAYLRGEVSLGIHYTQFGREQGYHTSWSDPPELYRTRYDDNIIMSASAGLFHSQKTGDIGGTAQDIKGFTVYARAWYEAASGDISLGVDQPDGGASEWGIIALPAAEAQLGVTRTYWDDKSRNFRMSDIGYAEIYILSAPGSETKLDQLWIVWDLRGVMSKPAFLRGQDTSNSSTGAYLQGSSAGTGVDSSTGAFLKGKDTDSSSTTAYLAGSIDISSSTDAYVHGSVVVTDAQDAYVAGQLLDSNSTSAFLVGGVIATNSQSAYLEGQDDAIDNQPAYTKGQNTANASQIAYVQGSDVASGNAPAFLSGGIAVADSRQGYTHGQALTSDFQSGFTQGSDTDVTSQDAYTKGQDTALDNVSAYLNGGIAVTDALDAYLEGQSVAKDNVSAFLNGQDTALDNTTAFVQGSTDTSSSADAFLVGGIFTQDSTVVFLKGQVEITSTQDVYLVGQSTGTDSILVFLQGRVETQDSTGAFLDADVHENLVPDGNITVGSWKNELEGSTLWSSIDEIPFVDSDYVYYDSASGSESFEVSLSDPAHDSDGTGVYAIYWRSGKLDGTKTIVMKVELRQGSSTLIASDQETITDSFVTYEYLLTQNEIDSITDFDDLRLRFIVVSVT